MKSSFILSALFFCLLTLITNGQNVLPERTFENFKKSKGLMLNPDDDMSMHERSMSRDLSWQVSTGQRQDPTINPRANNRKKKDISKLNDSKYRPVTIAVDDKYRYSYTYDENGNQLTSLSETLTNNVWENVSRLTYTYNNSENELTRLFETFTNNAWVNSGRFTYTYDNDGNCLTSLDETWTNNTWVNSGRYTYTYDTNGNMLTSIRETWTNNVWVNSGRYTYTYDTNGNMLTYLSESWLTNTWVNFKRSTNTYDTNGNLLTGLSESWTNNAWVHSSRNTSTYNNNGKVLTKLIEYWSNNAWVNLIRSTYNYDNNGNLLIQLSESPSNNTWVNYTRSTYTYDNNGNELTQLMESWRNSVWEYGWQYTYTYDNSGNAIKGESFYWRNWDSSWVKASGSLTLNYNSRTDYIYFNDATTVNVTYTLIATDIRDNQLAANTYSLSQNYPNPFNPTTVIEYALPYESNVSITVYNTLGQVVKTFNEGTKQTGSYNVNFNGEGLSSGIYLYNINTVSLDGKQNFHATKKMLLIK